MNSANEHYQNPFDNEQNRFYVLLNEHQQYSLWPEFAKLPAGWEVILQPLERHAAVAYIEKHWHSINPFHPIAENA